MMNAKQFQAGDTFGEFISPSPQDKRAPELNYHLLRGKIYSLASNSSSPTR